MTATGASIDQGAVADYYDDFTKQLLYDYLRGNRRVARQEAFFRDALCGAPQDVLVIGCGIGDTTARLSAERQVRSILGVDISPEAIEIARTLFSDSSAQFRVADITETAPEGQWDLVLLPDVYEHIPIAKRASAHRNLRSLLKDNGRLALTIPSPAHQRSLLARGHGLQVVDEIVELSDLQSLASDLNGWLSFYSHVSVFRTFDYIHAVIQAGGGAGRRLTDADRAMLTRSREDRPPLLKRAFRGFKQRTNGRARRLRVKRRLGAEAVRTAARMLK